MSVKLNTIILAAGQGSRMRSALPKVLHTLAGKPMIDRILDTAALLPNNQLYVICGHGADQLKAHCADRPITFVEQAEQKGTGHAVDQALPLIPDEDLVLVLSGDVPLIEAATLQALCDAYPKDGLSLLVAEFENPTGLGRIVRNEHGLIEGIVEERDATEVERNLHEIYTGVMLTSAANLKQWLPKLSPNNAQNEYYLTEVIRLAVEDSAPITSVNALIPERVSGVNDFAQLAALERFFQKDTANTLLKQGVKIIDPNRFDVRGTLTVGTDVTLDVNLVVEGTVSLGNNVTVGPNVVLRNVTVGDHVVIEANSVIEETHIAEHCVIGPFARLRPGTMLGPKVRIGNFVEIKNSDIHEASKVNHLSYIGDSDIGKHVNIGAGTITCNYDGAKKHRTTIHDGVFVGSDTQLVAPITIGQNATIGAGSTVTKDSPANALTLSRAEQRTINDWQRPKKGDA